MKRSLPVLVWLLTMSSLVSAQVIANFDGAGNVGGFRIVPDSLRVDLYAQDAVNYTWVEDIYYAVNLPKGRWYPLSFPPTQHYPNNPSFNTTNNNLNLTTIQAFPSSTAWTGVVYVDNVRLVGATPAISNSFAAQSEIGNMKLSDRHNINAFTRPLRRIATESLILPWRYRSILIHPPAVIFVRCGPIVERVGPLCAFT